MSDMCENKPIGYVHSLQTLGAVDGPGIRFCVFMQGCPLRCMYCHNPDTWRAGGTPYSVSALSDRIERCKTYFSGGGGVTVSGGEPLMQAEFVTALFTELRARGIHTCLDTSGMYSQAFRQAEKDSSCCSEESGERDREKVRRLLAVTDLVICDIKFTSEDEYQRNTGGSLKTVLEFIDMTGEAQVPLMVRHVVVPGYTDAPSEVSEMSRLAHGSETLTRIELLPFRKLCLSKYEELGIPFRCADIPECSAEKIDELKRYI